MGKVSTTSRNVIGLRVRQARNELDLTQDQLSGRLAGLMVTLDRAAVAKIELGLRCVYDFEIVGLATVLKVGTHWLLTGEK